MHATLTHRAEQYEIDLETCTTSAEALDWIIQVVKKPWADAQTLATLVRALNTLLDPQRYLCRNGQERGPSMSWRCSERHKRRGPNEGHSDGAG